METVYYMINDTYIAAFNKLEWTLKVGNPLELAMPCVVIDVHEKESRFYLASLSHHPSCNLSENLPHGTNGTVKMLKLAIVFAKSLFPHISRIEFEDTSGYTDMDAGFNVHLSDKSFYSTGHTWYQEHLSEIGLKPKRSQDRQYLQTYVNLLNAYPSEKDIRSLRNMGFHLSKRKTILENLNLSQNFYRLVFALQSHYHLRSLYGWMWSGKIRTMNPFHIEYLCHPYTKPLATALKAKWGGRPSDHLPNNFQ